MSFPFLDEDETTYDLRPRVSWAYARRGRDVQVARQAASAKQGRIAGSIEVNTGVLTTRPRAHFSVQEMYHDFRFVARHSSKAERITIALDNWPVHFPPLCWRNWPSARAALSCCRDLPTPRGPIRRKRDRLLAKDVLKQQAFVEDWPGLKQTVTDWLARYEHGSEALLHSVGLRSHSFVNVHK